MAKPSSSPTVMPYTISRTTSFATNAPAGRARALIPVRSALCEHDPSMPAALSPLASARRDASARSLPPRELPPGTVSTRPGEVQSRGADPSFLAGEPPIALTRHHLDVRSEADTRAVSTSTANEVADEYLVLAGRLMPFVASPFSIERL